MQANPEKQVGRRDFDDRTDEQPLRKDTVATGGDDAVAGLHFLVGHDFFQ